MKINGMQHRESEKTRAYSFSLSIRTMNAKFKVVIYNIFSFSYSILNLLRAQKSLLLQFHLPSYLLFLTLVLTKWKISYERSLCMHLSVWTSIKGFGFPLSTDHFSLMVHHVLGSQLYGPPLSLQSKSSYCFSRCPCMNAYVCTHMDT